MPLSTASQSAAHGIPRCPEPFRGPQGQNCSHDSFSFPTQMCAPMRAGSSARSARIKAEGPRPHALHHQVLKIEQSKGCFPEHVLNSSKKDTSCETSALGSHLSSFLFETTTKGSQVHTKLPPLKRPRVQPTDTVFYLEEQLALPYGCADIYQLLSKTNGVSPPLQRKRNEMTRAAANAKSQSLSEHQLLGRTRTHHCGSDSFPSVTAFSHEIGGVNMI